MKTTIKREALLQALTDTAPATKGGGHTPILQCALLHVVNSSDDGVGLQVTTSNLEMEITSLVDVQDIDETGTACVAHDRLAAIVKAMPEGEPIRLGGDGVELLVTCGDAQFDLMAFPADDFPRIDNVKPEAKASAPAASLAGDLSRAQHAMAVNDVRHYLNGAVIELGETHTVATTDGHRLAAVPLSVESDIKECSKIIPHTAVDAWIRACKGAEGDADVALGARYASLSLAGLDIVTALVDGRFPDWRRVLPKDTTVALPLPRKRLLASLRRVLLAADRKTPRVLLAADSQGVTLTAGDGRSSGRDWIQSDDDLPQITLSVNGAYLIEALNSLSDDSIIIHATDAESAILVVDQDSNTGERVVMPLK